MIIFIWFEFQGIGSVVFAVNKAFFLIVDWLWWYLWGVFFNRRSGLFFFILTRAAFITIWNNIFFIFLRNSVIEIGDIFFFFKWLTISGRCKFPDIAKGELNVSLCFWTELVWLLLFLLFYGQVIDLFCCMILLFWLYLLLWMNLLLLLQL